MANRREILQAAAAATAATAAAPMARAGQAEAASLAAVIVDRRFEPSRAFGRHMAEQGRRVLEIEADVTDVWLKELKPLWTEKPRAIAGLTSRSSMFCLEQLAWEHRMRVVYHAEHAPKADGGFAHELLASHGFLVTDYASAGSSWPIMAAVVTGGEVWATRSKGPSPAGLAPAHEGTAETLASFVIAPIRKA